MQPKLQWKSTAALFLAALFLLNDSFLGKKDSSAPVALTGVRGIEWYDSSKGMPPIFISPEVRAFWDSSVVKDSKTQVPEHRTFDTSLRKEDVEHETDGIKKYFEVKPAVVPGVVIGDGKRGYNGPIPSTGDASKDIPAYLDLLKKYVPK